MNRIDEARSRVRLRWKQLIDDMADTAERELIIKTLNEYGPQFHAAAKSLGLSDSELIARIEHYELTPNWRKAGK